VFITGTSGILNRAQFTYQAFISANGQPTSVPTFLQSSARLDRATEKVNSDEITCTNLSYSAHTHTQWIRHNTRAFDLFSYWLLVVGCPGNSYCSQKPSPHSLNKTLALAGSVGKQWEHNYSWRVCTSDVTWIHSVHYAICCYVCTALGVAGVT